MEPQPATDGTLTIEDLWQASDEEKAYGAVTAGLKEILAGQCVYCHHCLPCPVEIPVGAVVY